jgi:hypothetical protein
MNAIIVAGCFLFAAQAQINITGKVTDPSTYKGVKGALVTLKVAKLSATTNDTGGYTISSGIAVRFFGQGQGQIIRTPFFKQNILSFGVANDGEQVRLDVYSLTGRRVVCLLDRTLNSGNYQINPYLSTLANQVYFVKLQAGAKTSMFKMPFVDKRAAASGSTLKTSDFGDLSAGLAKAGAAVNDTLVATATGYNTTSKPISSYSGTLNLWLVTTGTHAGSIMFDNGSYSGCQTAAAVIVDDLDLWGPTAPQTVTVRVKSNADPKGFSIQLKMDTTTAGQYIDSIHFNINASDSATHTLMVQQPAGAMGDSIYAIYVDAAPPAIDTTMVQWSGNVGNVGPGASQYFGLAFPVIVNLNDPDLTDSLAYVFAKDSADTVGIKMTLHPVVGSTGSYSGKLWVSTAGSSQANGVLKVFGKNILSGENITLIYYDLTPKQTEYGSICTWFPTLGTLSTDSLAYHGLGDTMAITLTDNDISLNKAAVRVTSKKDPTGFIDSLTFNGTSYSRKFGGNVGFSTTASSAAKSVIAVQSPDTITLIYTDVNPDSVVTRKVPWSAQ